MAFTVEDFRDLIELLAQHPEWRAELRRHVLSEDLIELPALVRQLVEAQARTETRVAELVEAQARSEARLEGVEARLEGVEARLEGVEVRLDRVEARLDRVEARLDRVEARLEGVEVRMDRVEAAIERLVEAQVRTEARVDELAASLARTEVIVSRHTDQLGELQGEALELRYARRAPSYFSPIARRLHVIEHGALAELLDDAVDDDRLTIDERDEIMRADLVLTGRRRQDSQDVYLVAELSVGVGPHDVERAVTRAALLAKLGKPSLPVVAGESVTEQAAALAREQGVWYAEGGRVTDPQEA